MSYAGGQSLVGRFARLLLVLTALTVAGAGCVQPAPVDVDDGRSPRNASSMGGLPADHARNASGASAANATVAETPTVDPSPEDGAGAEALLRRALGDVPNERNSIVVRIANGSRELSWGRMVADPAADATLVELRATAAAGLPLSGEMSIYSKGSGQGLLANGTAYVALRGGSRAAGPDDSLLATFLPDSSVPDLRNATVRNFSTSLRDGRPVVEARLALVQLGLPVEASAVFAVSPARLLRVEVPFVTESEVEPPPCPDGLDDLPPESEDTADAPQDDGGELPADPPEEEPADPPPESDEWTDEQWDAWYAAQEPQEDEMPELPAGGETWTDEDREGWNAEPSTAFLEDDVECPAEEPRRVTVVAGRVTAEFEYGEDVALAIPAALDRAVVLAFRTGDDYTGPGPRRTLTFAATGGIAISDVEAHVKRPRPENANSLPDPARMETIATFRLGESARVVGDVTISFEDRDHDGNVSRGDRLVLARSSPGGFPTVFLFDAATQTYVVPSAGLALAVVGVAAAALLVRRLR